MSKQNLVSVNVTELKEFLTHIVENNRFLQSQGKLPVSTEVIGESGIGKTSAIVQLAKELDLNFVKLNLAQIEEIGDLVGFPIRQFEVKDDKETIWIDEHAFDEYLKLGYKSTGQNRMSYCPPEWIANKSNGGILLLDDWNRADLRFIQACMELIDRQTYVSWKLPKGWTILLSQNPDNGDYSVTAQDVAQTTRYITVEMKFDVNTWAKWAEGFGIDGRGINFILMNPELVTQNVNPRAITTFFNAISSIEKFEEQLPLIQMIGEGSVGAEFSSMFTMFINNKMDKIISPKDIMTNTNETYVVGALNGAVGTGDDFRADISSIITTRIINYSLKHASEHAVSDVMIDRLVKLTTDCEAFTNDLKYFMVKEILAGNKPKFARLMQNPLVVKMAVK
jgi:hypothetical protein